MTTRNRRRARGFTILENMLAMAVLTFGATGVTAIHRQSQSYLGDARKITRAAAFAGDLVTQIQLWDFDDPRLANANPANDVDLGDTTLQFELQDPPPADHGEADLNAGGRVWTGVPGALLDQNGMQRYWNVSYDAVDSNGNVIFDAVRIAVIVRWRAGIGWRRIVLPMVKVNPAERM